MQRVSTRGAADPSAIEIVQIWISAPLLASYSTLPQSDPLCAMAVTPASAHLGGALHAFHLIGPPEAHP